MLHLNAVLLSTVHTISSQLLQVLRISFTLHLECSSFTLWLLEKEKRILQSVYTSVPASPRNWDSSNFVPPNFASAQCYWSQWGYSFFVLLMSRRVPAVHSHEPIAHTKQSWKPHYLAVVLFAVLFAALPSHSQYRLVCVCSVQVSRTRKWRLVFEIIIVYSKFSFS